MSAKTFETSSPMDMMDDEMPSGYGPTGGATFGTPFEGAPERTETLVPLVQIQSSVVPSPMDFEGGVNDNGINAKKGD